VLENKPLLAMLGWFWILGLKKKRWLLFMAIPLIEGIL